jgi:hypothetical protein
MRTKKSLLAAFAVTALLTATNLNAQTLILSWNIYGANAATTPSFSGNVTHSSLATSGVMSMSANITAVNLNNSYRGTPFNQTTLASAIDNNQYIQFTLVPAEALNLEQVFFNTSTATAGAFSYHLFSSKTGFAEANSLYSGTNNSQTGYVPNTVNLSGVTELQNLDEEVQFRVYGYRAAAGTTAFGFAGGEGTVSVGVFATAVPEPSTMGLLGLAGIGLAWSIARSRKKNS